MNSPMPPAVGARVPDAPVPALHGTSHDRPLLRLLFFIYTLTGGGAERVTAHLASYWARKGWDVTIVTLTSSTSDFYAVHPSVRRISLDLAGDSRSLLMAFAANVRRVSALRRVLKQVNPDVAVAMIHTSNVMLGLASWQLSGLCAIGSERTFPKAFPLANPWETLRRITYKRLAAVVAVSSEAAEWLRRHTSARRVSVIPNMALWPLPSGMPRIAPETAGASDRHIILAVGRLVRNKGFDRLLDVFASLASKHESWDVVILGEGSERGLLEAQIWAANLNGRVLLPGRAGNVGEWYERADLFVLCSHFEGFPNTLVEAMAYGVPAVSFDCDTGPRDIVRHGVDGLLVSPGDIAGLQAALDRLMGDHVLRAQFAARALDVRTRFSIERVAGMWEELFAQIRQA